MNPEAVDPKPWYLRKSTWAAAAGYCVDIAAMAALFADLLPPEKAAALIVVGTAIGRLQAIFARMGGVEAAKKAAVMGPGDLDAARASFLRPISEQDR